MGIYLSRSLLKEVNIQVSGFWFQALKVEIRHASRLTPHTSHLTPHTSLLTPDSHSLINCYNFIETEFNNFQQMVIDISTDAVELGAKAAHFAAMKINEAIKLNNEARMVVSTGSSQFETFDALLKEKIEWNKVEVFHLDEYIGLPVTHNASFRKYLYDRFIGQARIKKFHSVDVEGNIDQIIKLLTSEIRIKPVDVGLIGIGVNGHIAFNDPPADFDTRKAFHVVNLDEQCRLQQVNEGWFKSLNEVPLQAVSMTPWQIMQCKTIISCVPHKVKATSIKNTLINKLTEIVPATILKQHRDFQLYLDVNSASEIIVI